MKHINEWGGFAAFYMAIAYILNMVLFLVVLNYPNITNIAQKVELIVNKSSILFLTNLVGYVFFGVALIVFVLALSDKLKAKSGLAVRVAAVLGFIWAGSLIASGMVANAGLATTSALNAQDPQAAALYWTSIETVANGLGNANGEILGGLMTLLFGLATLRSGQVSKVVSIIGIVVGFVGVITLVPALNSFVSIFGIGQIVWFIWLGILLLRQKNENA